MLFNELQNKKEQILLAAEKYGASNISIFGSVARGEERNDSDVDILVSLPRGYDIFKQRLALQEELENITGRNVDLVIRHEMNKYLEASILNDERMLSW